MVKIKQRRNRGRRPSPTPEEIDRINETIFNRAGFKIQDRDSYDLAFNDYLNINEGSITSAEKKLRDNSFEEFISQHPEVSKERLFTKAKGKDLRRDRLKTAKRVVRTRKEFIKQTAPEVDLKGFDTARQKVSKEILRRRTFTVPATIKGRVVFAIQITNKRGIKQLKDSKGRFVSARVK